MPFGLHHEDVIVNSLTEAHGHVDEVRLPTNDIEGNWKSKLVDETGCVSGKTKQGISIREVRGMW